MQPARKLRLRKHSFAFTMSCLLTFSCTTTDPITIIVPEARTVYLYDYGNSGNSTDFLLSIDFKSEITQEYEVRLLLAKSENELSLDMARALPEDRYEVLEVEPFIFKGRLKKILLDADGDEIINNETYVAYALVADKADNSNAVLSNPSKPLMLKDERVQDVYALTSEIRNYNPYLLLKKPLEVNNFPASVDMTFDSDEKMLVLTKSEGLLEYNASGFDTLIPSLAFVDPKVVRIGPEGFIYVIDGTSIFKYERDGTFVETFLKDLIAPSSIAWDHFGQFYITERIPDGRILTYNKSKELIHSFIFTTAPITPKAVTYNRALKQIFINRTSVNGTGIVTLEPESQEWNLIGSLQFIGTFSDTFTTNAAGHVVIVHVDAKDGPQICVVENKLNQDLDIIEISPPLDSVPLSIVMGPLQ